MIGTILGLMLGILIGLIVWMVIVENVDYDKEWIGIVIWIGIAILSSIIGFCINIQIDKVNYNKKIANWNITKNTLERSIRDESLGDTARINLVNKAIEYNMQLTELKEDVKCWWYWYLDDSRVNELELIDINEHQR